MDDNKRQSGRSVEDNRRDVEKAPPNTFEPGESNSRAVRNDTDAANASPSGTRTPGGPAPGSRPTTDTNKAPNAPTQPPSGTRAPSAPPKQPSTGNAERSGDDE